MSVESCSWACEKNHEFAENRFIPFAPWWDCKSAAPILNLDASLIAQTG